MNNPSRTSPTKQMFSVQPEIDKENQVSRRKRDKANANKNPFETRVFRNITTSTTEEKKEQPRAQTLNITYDSLLVSSYISSVRLLKPASSVLWPAIRSTPFLSYGQSSPPSSWSSSAWCSWLAPSPWGSCGWLGFWAWVSWCGGFWTPARL